jgi:hypothetical protein
VVGWRRERGLHVKVCVGKCFLDGNSGTITEVAVKSLENTASKRIMPCEFPLRTLKVTKNTGL